MYLYTNMHNLLSKKKFNSNTFLYEENVGNQFVHERRKSIPVLDFNFIFIGLILYNINN